jgi:glycosyltransferase involved in cell wall biosynthesis
MTATSHERPGPPAPAEVEALPPIAEPYALFVCVPIEVDEQGRRWTMAAWAKDLALHLDYISDLTLVSPAIRVKMRSAGTVSLDEPPFDRLKFIDLPSPTGKWETLKTLPGHLLKYWQAIGPARVVHSGFAGWPIVQAWIAVPLAKLRGKFALGNVESSPWRASGAGLPWHKRLRGTIGEVITRTTLRMADLKLVTSKQYYKDLLLPGTPGAYVTPATWLNEEWILEEDQAVAAWDAKEGPVRLLFVGRLLRDKGVPQLLSAIRSTAEAGTDVEFSIIGSGPLRDECIAAARSLTGRATVTVLDEVPYGEPFFDLVRGYDAVLVPSVSDEQPRIAYDAFSQAVPIIGSATGGICEVVEPGVTGRLSPPNDVDALTESIIWAGRNRPALREMGLRGPARVRHSTHQAMHRNRHKLLLEALRARREAATSAGKPQGRPSPG